MLPTGRGPVKAPLGFYGERRHSAATGGLCQRRRMIFVKILILTGKFGMGHLSAAQALQEQLRQAGHRADTVDLFEYALPGRAAAMYWWFNVLVTYGGGERVPG